MEIKSSMKSMDNDDSISVLLSSFASCHQTDSYADMFEKFSLTFENLKKPEGYVCIDLLNIDHSCNSECIEILNQLKIREEIINLYRKYLKDFVNYVKTFENARIIAKNEDEEITEEMRQFTKFEGKKEKFLITEKVFCNKSMQTSEYTCDVCVQTDIDFTSELKLDTNQDKLNKNAEEEFMDYSQNYFRSVKQGTHNSTEVQGFNLHDAAQSSFTKCDDKIIPLQNNNIESVDSNQMSYENGKFDNNSWNHSSIQEEVQAVAEEVTNQLGYVFIDDIGMYYDQSSGYYYDDKTSLFYDGKTGTYFYYNHETNNYEFYSQVDPLPSTQQYSSVDAINKKRKIPKETQDREEGECSSSDEDEIIEDTKEVAPSLRLMVMNGNLKGTLHIMTLNGGRLGREGDVEVLLKDPSVSKLHAEFSYQSEGLLDHHYFIRDLGSSNGTLVRKQRLSESKVPSDLIELGHGWEIQCGDVILSCHIHPGLLTCNDCEPGLVEGSRTVNTATMDRPSKQKLEKERRRQNKAIRKKFSLVSFEQEQPNSQYRDRAGKRREVVGSDNPYEKTQVASIETNLTKENKGFQLLQKMGWTEGQSLGTSDTGIKEPIVPSFSSGKTGLGAVGPPQETFQTTKKKTARKMAEVTKERYEKAGLLQEVRFTPASHDSNGS